MFTRRLDLEGFPISAFRLLSRLGALLGVIALVLVAGLAAPVRASAGAHVAQQAVRSWQVPAPDWSPSNKEAGRVDDLLRVGRRLYVAGNFTELANHGGKSVRRTYLASVRASTGRLGNFAPRIDGRVFALAKARGLLFVGGAFSSVNGHARHNLAAFNLRTGRLSREVRDLRIRGSVEALAATRRAVYVGGSFSSVGGRRRANLAKLYCARPLPGGARVEAPGERQGARDRGRLVPADRRRRRLHLCERPPAAAHGRAGRGPRGRVKRWARPSEGRDPRPGPLGPVDLRGRGRLRRHGASLPRPGRRPAVVLQDRRQHPGRHGDRPVSGVRDARRQRRAAQEPRHVGVRAQPPDPAAQDLHAHRAGASCGAGTPISPRPRASSACGRSAPAAETSTSAATSRRPRRKAAAAGDLPVTSERVARGRYRSGMPGHRFRLSARGVLFVVLAVGLLGIAAAAASAREWAVAVAALAHRRVDGRSGAPRPWCARPGVGLAWRTPKRQRLQAIESCCTRCKRPRPHFARRSTHTWPGCEVAVPRRRRCAPTRPTCASSIAGSGRPEEAGGGRRSRDAPVRRPPRDAAVRTGDICAEALGRAGRLRVHARPRPGGAKSGRARPRARARAEASGDVLGARGRAAPRPPAGPRAAAAARPGAARAPLRLWPSRRRGMRARDRRRGCRSGHRARHRQRRQGPRGPARWSSDERPSPLSRRGPAGARCDPRHDASS